MSTIGLILVIVLILALFGGGFSSYRGGPFLGTGVYGGGLVLVLIVIVLLLVFSGRI